VKINLRIEFHDGTFKDVVCSASDFVRFESRFDISIAVLETQMKFTHLVFLAWSAESRGKATAKTFEEWVDDIAGVEVSETNPK
jgi:hypothetical protein